MRLDKNCVAVVTGGASGLGEATVRLLRTYQVNVIVADLDEQNALKVTKEIGCDYHKTDVTNQEQVISLFDYVIKKYKKVDIVLNSAGILTLGLTIDQGKTLPTSLLIKGLMINVVGTFNVAKHAALRMSTQIPNEFNERGVIINVSSLAGFQGKNNQVIYATTKGAVLGMTLPMARDLGKHGIRVMSIAPGVFQTPMSNNGFAAGYQKYLSPMMPLGKVGKPIDFAKLVVSISENPFASGTNWRLDGGTVVPMF